MLILSINYWIASYALLLTLILLIVILIVIGKSLEAKKEKKALEKMNEQNLEAISGAEGAAIAMALNLYYANVYEDESNTLTIKHISSRYSPWNSKIYGIQ